MREQHNKEYKGRCQWNWHFSNGFLSGKQISTALLELKAKQNFFLYNTQESYSESQAADVLCGPAVEAAEVQSEKSCGVASPCPEETRHVTRKASPNSPFLKLCSVVKKVRLSFLPVLNSKTTGLLWRRACFDEHHRLPLLQTTQANYPTLPI